MLLGCFQPDCWGLKDGACWMFFWQTNDVHTSALIAWLQGKMTGAVVLALLGNGLHKDCMNKAVRGWQWLMFKDRKNGDRGTTK